MNAPDTMPVPAMPGETRWLFSFDFDGTLWGSDRRPQISGYFFELMRRWRTQYGVRWGINTGRSMEYLWSEYAPLAPFAPDFVVTSERYVWMAGPEGGLVPDAARNARCRREHALLFERFHDALEALFHELRERFPSSRWSRSPEDPYAIEVEQVSDLDLFSPHMRALLARCPGLSVQRAGPYLRFCHAGYNKGTSLMHLAQAWKVPPRRVAILGDGHNDLDAFRLLPAAFRGGPANAHRDVREFLESSGGTVSSYVEHRGVLDLLETHVALLLARDADMCDR